MPACEKLVCAFRDAWADAAFRGEYDAILRDYAGRPSSLSECHNLGERLGLDRCSSARTSTTRARTRSTTSSAKRCRQADGQAPVHRRDRRGQHGVATATAAALMGLECKVYMGAVDVARQELNVFRMRLLGAEVEAVESGSRTLKDAVNGALRTGSPVSSRATTTSGR